MDSSHHGSERAKTAFKALVALIFLVSALAFVAGRLFPERSIFGSLILALALLAGIIALLVVTVLIEGWVNRFTLSHGGTDVQWLWFPWESKPKGLEQLQAQQQKEKRVQSPGSTDSPNI